MKKVLLSGIKPTGTLGLHLGNYFGAIKQFVDMQDSYDSYVFVADLHALTTVHDAEQMRKNIFDIAAAYLACGLDPKKVVLFKQSDVAGPITELTWIFNCITTVPYLERAHAYKDAEVKNHEVSVGLFDYPILMASDILIQDADVVPVGADQKQHVEYARDTAQKFNRIWGETFTIPEPLILEDTGVVPGTDGRKMSKSYGNTISLFATDEEITKAVMGIVTNSDGSHPHNIVAIHKLIKPWQELDSIYQEHSGKFGKLKEILAKDLQDFIRPLREKYLALQANPEEVYAELRRGAETVRVKVEAKQMQFKKAVGLE